MGYVSLVLKLGLRITGKKARANRQSTPILSLEHMLCIWFFFWCVFSWATQQRKHKHQETGA